MKITTLFGAVQATGDLAMAGAPYSGITVAYYTANQSRTINGVACNFKIIIAGNGATLEQIYAKIQFLLRQATDINTGGTAGSKVGKIQADLLTFVGDTLVTSNLVYIDNIQATDSNRIELRRRRYEAHQSVCRCRNHCNSPLVGAGSSYRLMFSALRDVVYSAGESGAVTRNNASGTPITGTISATSFTFDYDYDGNTQEWLSAGTDRPVTLIGIRPGSGIRRSHWHADPQQGHQPFAGSRG